MSSQSHSGLSRAWEYLKRTLPLLPLPIIWLVAEHLGWLQPLQNIAMDWRFQVRGAEESPVPLYYVNLDQAAIREWGEALFPREVHAEVARALIEEGEAGAVAFDFIFSPIAHKIDADFVREGELALARLARDHGSRVVFGSAYSGALLDHMQVNREGVPSILPLKYRLGPGDRVYDPATNPFPETPVYPIWQPSYSLDGQKSEGWGRVGVINYDLQRSGGAVTRWMPGFVEVENEQLSLMVLIHQGRDMWREIPAFAGQTEAIFEEDAIRLSPRQTISLPSLGNRADLMNIADIEITDQGTAQFNFYPETPLIRVPKVIPKTFHTIALETLLAYHWLRPELAVVKSEDFIEVRDYRQGNRLLYQIPLTDGQMIEINWFSPWSSGLARGVEYPDYALFGGIVESGNELEEGEVTMAQDRPPLDWQLYADPHNPKVSLYLVYYQNQRLKELRQELQRPDLPSLEREQRESQVERIEAWFGQFKNAIILIGPTDPLLQDIAPTPFDPAAVPRVSAHGNLIKTIVSGEYIERLPGWTKPVIVLVITLIIALFSSATGQQGLILKSMGGLLLIGYAGGVFLAFSTNHLVLPLVTPMGAAITTTIVAVVLQLVKEERQKSRIRNMFGTYLAPEVVSRMVDSGTEPKLGGEEVEITALFSDVQSFSAFSEILSPAQLVELMNEYLGPMTNILDEERGTLDKYIGDAIVAMFGAPAVMPDHAYRACLTAHRMQLMQAELRDRWASQGDRWPGLVHQMRTRIGLNSGLTTVGNMGSEKRFNYTFMGDTVNLAARCESGAKAAGVYTLITRQTKESADEHGGGLVFRFVDKWRVKGRRQPVDMFELVGFQGDISEESLEAIAHYENALAKYFARDWNAAIALLERAQPHEILRPGRDIGVKTNPTLILLERCHLMRETPPPEDWDGVFTMETK